MTFLAAQVCATERGSIKDRIAIASHIEAVGSLADAGHFEQLERLYSDEVMVDYSSLSGQPAELKSAKALMTEWAGVLPGFDITKHQLSNIDVKVEGELAFATADVTADHYIEDLFWQVTGHYRYQFAHQDGDWRIVSHQFLVDGETGTRDVFGLAIAQAKRNPAPYFIRQQSERVVRHFLAALAQQDKSTLVRLLSDDAVLDMSLSQQSSGQRASDADAVIARLVADLNNLDKAQLGKLLRIYPVQDPTLVLAEWQVEGTQETAQRTAVLPMAGLFHVVDGKVVLIRLYTGG